MSCLSETRLPVDAGPAGQGGKPPSGSRSPAPAQREAGSSTYPDAHRSEPDDAAGSELMDAGCTTSPCPADAPWDQARCACVARDAGSPAGECKVDSDCVLMPLGCCPACQPLPTRDAVLAVAKTREVDAYHEQCPQPVLCVGSACVLPDPDYGVDPLAPLLHAGCIAQRCEIVDLRQAGLSRCTTDADCRAIGAGCCPPTTDSPEEYVGVRKDADIAILQCSPVPSCAPAQPHVEPLPFCASDGHCAVRMREQLGGKASDDCYSPAQNLERAYEATAVGCDCRMGTAPLCRRGVALHCIGDRWQSEEDGSCAPHPGRRLPGCGKSRFGLLGTSRAGCAPRPTAQRGFTRP
jgi:hypothetical protein